LGVEFDSADVPEPGTQLTDAAGAAAGVITSAAWSPRTERAVGLAYVPRKIEAPASVAGGVVKDLPLA
jgi:glycine cleavage system aminomethyltransferase T